jgi:hypothetical protein
MTAGLYNLYIEKGATYNRVLTWNDKDGNPINLTGFSARLHIRKTKGSDTTILSLSIGSGITLGGSNGTISILVAASVTAAIEESAGVYDLELVNGSEVTRLLEGTVTFSPEVTRV